MDVLGLLGAGVVCLRRDVYTSVRMINREPDADLTLGRNDTTSLFCQACYFADLFAGSLRLSAVIDILEAKHVHQALFIAAWMYCAIEKC